MDLPIRAEDTALNSAESAISPGSITGERALLVTLRNHNPLSPPVSMSHPQNRGMR
jgi:hypothetical protein